MSHTCTLFIVTRIVISLPLQLCKTVCPVIRCCVFCGSNIAAHQMVAVVL